MQSVYETLASFNVSMNLRLIRGTVAGILLLLFVWLAKGVSLPVNDSVAYWATARLLLNHQNPYDTKALLALERQVGYTRKTPLATLNPPWILPFLMPLAFFSYPEAQKLWLVFACACVAFSIYLLWKLYGRTRYPTPAAWLLLVLFTPLLMVLAIGQVGPLVILGIAGFLWFEQRQKYGYAAVCLFLLTLKPHLVFLFWITFGLWLVRKKQWQMLLCFAGTFAAVNGLVILFDRQIFSQYHDFWIRNPARWSEFPTLSGILAHLSGSQNATVAFLPPALASIWLLRYWFRFHDHWNWQNEIPVLLLVSLVASPYAWFFDGVILLPVLIQLIALPSWKQGKTALLVCYGAVNVLVIVLIGTGRHLFWYAWVAPAWLLLYVWACSMGKSEVLSSREF